MGVAFLGQAIDQVMDHSEKSLVCGEIFTLGRCRIL